MGTMIDDVAVIDDVERRLRELERHVQRLLDAEAVRDLVFTYQRLCDGGWAAPSHADPDALADLFTADGEYSIDASRPSATGTDEIRQRFVRLQSSMPWIIHYATNPIVVVDGDAATARVQGYAAYRRDDVGWQAFGTYEGGFSRTADGWRFASWVFHLADSRAA